MDREIKKLFQRRNVVSVGLGRKMIGGRDTGELAVVIGVRKKLPPAELTARDVVPAIVKGLITDVVEIGEIKLL